jgi:hypothetical protein
MTRVSELLALARQREKIDKRNRKLEFKLSEERYKGWHKFSTSVGKYLMEEGFLKDLPWKKDNNNLVVDLKDAPMLKDFFNGLNESYPSQAAFLMNPLIHLKKYDALIYNYDTAYLMCGMKYSNEYLMKSYGIDLKLIALAGELKKLKSR